MGDHEAVPLNRRRQRFGRLAGGAELRHRLEPLAARKQGVAAERDDCGGGGLGHDPAKLFANLGPVIRLDYGFGRSECGAELRFVTDARATG